MGIDRAEGSILIKEQKVPKRRYKDPYKEPSRRHLFPPINNIPKYKLKIVPFMRIGMSLLL